MDIEEKMIDYIINKATREEQEEFFGFCMQEIITKEECEDNISQMPDEVFDELANRFGLVSDTIKC